MSDYNQDEHQTGSMSLQQLQEAFEQSNKNLCNALQKIIDALQDLRDEDCELPPFCDDEE
jgi:hypothetical protein